MTKKEHARHGGKYGQLLDLVSDVKGTLAAITEGAEELADLYSDDAEAMREYFPNSEKADEYDEISLGIMDWIDELDSAGEGPPV